MLLLVGIFVGLPVTALFGRVWCGWACRRPSTWSSCSGRSSGCSRAAPRPSSELDREDADPAPAIKYAVFGSLAVPRAHVPRATSSAWSALDSLGARARPSSTRPDSSSWPASTALMFLDFGCFREQMCIVACPYGRLQSVLLDRHSLIVGYDASRGEPRGHGASRRPAPARRLHRLRRLRDDVPDRHRHPRRPADGVHRLHAVHRRLRRVMDRIGRPARPDPLQVAGRAGGRPRRMLRPRVVLYPLMIGRCGARSGGASRSGRRRRHGASRHGRPFGVLPYGKISNQIRIKVVNRLARSAATGSTSSGRTSGQARPSR